MPSMTLSIDGQRIATASPLGLGLELKLHGVALNMTRSVLRCEIFEEDAADAAASFEFGAGDDPSEWVSLPGTRCGRRSLSYDVPGFTVCFDVEAAADDQSTLRIVRVARQALAGCSPAAGAAVACRAARAADEDCVDACDGASLPTISRAAHGAWLREESRPGRAAVAWTALSGAPLAALQHDARALVSRHGCGGRTYWIGASAAPRCSLEAAALEVLAFHTPRAGAAGEGECTGAEWWVQLRSIGPPGAAAGEAAEDDASSIAFHFDCDEATLQATGEMVPPWLSTVSYLSCVGAPTLILPARSDAEGRPLALAELGAYVSYPRLGKHIVFDGRLLHGCPHGLTRDAEASPAAGGASPPHSPPAEAGGRAPRLTLLVNLWRRHRPVGPQPLPQAVAAALAPPPTTAYFAPRDTVAPADVATLGGEAERTFAPTAARRKISPAAQTVELRGFPSSEALLAAPRSAGLVHASAVEMARG
jgi:hypothetical protein